MWWKQSGITSKVSIWKWSTHIGKWAHYLCFLLACCCFSLAVSACEMHVCAAMLVLLILVESFSLLKKTVRCGMTPDIQCTMVYVYVHCTIYPGIVRCLLLARIFEAYKKYHGNYFDYTQQHMQIQLFDSHLVRIFYSNRTASSSSSLSI